MKLGLPALERRIREAARRELRQDGALWKEYQEHRSHSRRLALPPGFFPLWYVVLFVFFVGAQYQDVEHHRSHLFFTALAMYAVATTVYRSLRFRSDLIAGNDRAILGHLPVSDEEFLRRKLHRWIAGWAEAALIFFIAYFVGLAGLGLPHEQLGPNIFRPHLLGPVVVSAFLQAACGLCAGMWLLVLTPTTLKTSLPKVFYVAAVACLFLPAQPIRVLWWITLATPAGWVSQSFPVLVGLAGTSRQWLIPAVALCASFPWAYWRLRRRLIADLQAKPVDLFLEFDESGELENKEDRFSHKFHE